MTAQRHHAMVCAGHYRSAAETGFGKNPDAAAAALAAGALAASAKAAPALPVAPAMMRLWKAAASLAGHTTATARRKCRCAAARKSRGAFGPRCQGQAAAVAAAAVAAAAAEHWKVRSYRAQQTSPATVTRMNHRLRAAPHHRRVARQRGGDRFHRQRQLDPQGQSRTCQSCLQMVHPSTNLRHVLNHIMVSSRAERALCPKRRGLIANTVAPIARTCVPCARQTHCHSARTACTCS
jgi:hypothetical protein